MKLFGDWHQPERVVAACLFVPFVLLNPLLLLLHGYIWTSEGGLSSAVLVYAMKLAPLAYLMGASLFLGPKRVLKALRSRIAIVGVVFLLLGLASPFVYQSQPSLFYYAADAAGMGATFAYFLVTKELFRTADTNRLRSVIFRVMVAGAAATSAVILGLYFWSGGNKVSIPPDIHYGIALAIVLYLTAARASVVLAPLVIIAGVGASQFRMNIIVAVLATGAAWFWTLIFDRSQMRWGTIGKTALLVLVLAGLFSQPLLSTFGRFGSFVWSPSQAIVEIETEGGLPVDQRYLESYLVFQEMKQQPASFLTGKGFGATFDTAEVLKGHGAREHSIHNSIAALFLRNGIFGVLLFLLPAILAVRTIFCGDRGLYVASIGLLVIYAACMTDQYVYWGGYYGIALAVWYCSWRAKPEEQSAT